MRPHYGPPPSEVNDRLKVPKPKNIKEIPAYLKKTVGGTCYRLFYIFKLVWETKPFLLFFMSLMTIYNGVMPLVGTLISATPLTRYFEKDGTELSIGQWQKLSVARAFYSDADILILDEPTASLDAIAEQEIYRQFDRLRKGKTSIFVSHRLSSATTADTVIVLENGNVAEMGSHEELMALHGKYYKLFSTQAERYQSKAMPMPPPPPPPRGFPMR